MGEMGSIYLSNGGRPRETRYITVREAIAHHVMVMTRYGEQEEMGIKDAALLESAIARPRQSAFGSDAYPDFFMKAAALFESLVKNHCFHNGNKRTGVAIVTTFLKMNGYVLVVEPMLLEDFTVAVAFRKDEGNEELLAEYYDLMEQLTMYDVHLNDGDADQRLEDIGSFFAKFSEPY